MVGPTAATAKAGRWGPMEAGPEYVTEVVVDARRAGLIPEAWVADARAADPVLPAPWDDADDFARTVARWAEEFHLDQQAERDFYVEVWVEAADLTARLARVARPLDVPVYSGGGFDGLKGKRASADRAVARFRDRGQPTVVLQVSDLDQHGLSMVDARVADIEAWTVARLPVPGPDGTGARVADVLRFERIAVTEAQAVEHDLLDDDGKAEADGVPVPVMDALLTDAIEAAWAPVPAGREEREQVERDRLADAIRAALNGDDET